MRDTQHRLTPLFLETGFLTNDEAASVNPGAPSGLYEILKSDVSIATFKNLFKRETKSPAGPGAPAAGVEESLHKPFRVTEEEAIHLLREFRADVKALLDDMVSAKLLTPEKRAGFDEMRLAAKPSQSDAELAVHQGFLTPEMVFDFVVKGGNGTVHLSHIFCALDLLLLNKVVTAKAAGEAVDRYQREGQPIPATLRESGALIPADLVAALKNGLTFPAAPMGEVQIPESLISQFPITFLRRETILPYRRKGMTVRLAVPDPLNFALFDTLTLLTGLWIAPHYAEADELLEALQELSTAMPARPKTVSRPSRPGTSVRSGAAGPASAPEAPQPAGADQPTKGSRKAQLADRDKHLEPAVVKLAGREAGAKPPDGGGRPKPIVIESRGPADTLAAVKSVTTILETAIKARATDVHIEPTRGETRVRLRIDGVLHEALKVPHDLTLACISRIKVLANMNVTERRRPQDGHFSLDLAQGSYDFRVATLPTHTGEKIVLRVLDASAMKKGIADLGMLRDQRVVIEELIRYPHGMILAVGPTGAGKSSTLYALLRALNREDVNIVTIEDPIEYELPGVQQVQVDTNIDLGFPQGLRAMLRQDPDVIMVGEIRDAETAQIGVRAAITGHIVLSTLHASTSPGAVTTLRQMNVPSYLISASLLGVISQRLVRRVCPQCARDVQPEIVRLRAVGIEPSEVATIREGKGCDQCFHSGFMGRIGVFEVMSLDDKLRRAILGNASEQDLQLLANESGMISLADAARRMVIEGLTTPEEIIDILLAFV